MQRLGLPAIALPKLRSFPNGEAAMRALSEAAETGAIGCTQETEILNTPGLRLVGPLPPGHELSTIYRAAVTARASDPAMAARLVAFLTGPETKLRRQRSGFGSSG